MNQSAMKTLKDQLVHKFLITVSLLSFANNYCQNKDDAAIVSDVANVICKGAGPITLLENSANKSVFSIFETLNDLKDNPQQFEDRKGGFGITSQLYEEVFEPAEMDSILAQTTSYSIWDETIGFKTTSK